MFDIELSISHDGKEKVSIGIDRPATQSELQGIALSCRGYALLTSAPLGSSGLYILLVHHPLGGKLDGAWLAGVNRYGMVWYGSRD